jgi:hypothetical protein
MSHNQHTTAQAGNLEFVLYDHFTPHLQELQRQAKELEARIHIPHEKPFEDDGAHCEDEE